MALRSAWLAIALLACSTQRAYDARAIPKRETALIRPASRLARQVFIRAVDGRELGWFRDRVRVPAGPHRLDVTVLFSIGGRAVLATHELQLDARPGAEYAVHAEWARYGPAAVLRDDRTDERIAAAEPTPPVAAGPR